MRNLLKGILIGALFATLVVGSYYTGKVDAAVDASKTYMNLRPQVSFVTGAAAAAGIYIAGIATADQLLDVWFHDTTITFDANTRWRDLGAYATIRAADTIAIADTATAVGQLMVFWHDVE